jgi:ADP-ribosylglycohydrolase
MSSSPEQVRRARIRSSALWAAYGDALGFMTELADSRTVGRRGVKLPVITTMPWCRRVGGRFGPTIQLPAGCISDDTQLRLATSRSIRSGGQFDVETFAKIELPVWSSYALGAGRGSQEAAANLRRRDVSWATNFFEADRSVYVNAGGNGAAIRIQPHVWSSGRQDNGRWRADVILNALTTHGHMRGILGALFHAACLREALEAAAVPGPKQWLEIGEQLYDVISIVQGHEHLQNLWLGLWEQRSGATLSEACDAVVFELRDNISAVSQLGTGGGGYNDAVETLGAFRPDERGSGIKTAVLGSVIAKLFEDDPEAALQTSANSLGTDTDSIATMAGALIGATITRTPEAPIVDRDYIEHEADRMWAIGEGRPVPNFPYPSLMYWTPPRSQTDCVGTTEDGLAVAGLGPITRHDKVVAGSGKNESGWGWVDIWFGQRLLIKQRAHPTPLQQSQRVSATTQYRTASLLDQPEDEPREQPVKPAARPVPRPSEQPDISSSAQTDGQAKADKDPRTLHVLTDEVINSGFDPIIVGRALLELAERSDGIELSGQFAAIITKARMTRLDRDRLR